MNERATAEQYRAIGESEEFLQLQEGIRRAAGVDRSVILIGERGTGKELAAARIHLLSSRWNGPYVTLNCSSLTPSLIESELFGHEAGAFTGATRLRRGRFELAHGGSLFLDEVADIPGQVQEKILRVVEYGRFERVGGSVTIDTDVRLIAATNADLRQLAAAGRFRSDLLDRLSFEVITLPPLRVRRDDILLLARHFARRMAAELGLAFQPTFSHAAEQVLLEHDWPGNIRELKNVVERMVYRKQDPCIDEILLDPFDSPFMPRDHTGAARTLRETARAPQSPEEDRNVVAGSLPQPHLKPQEIRSDFDDLKGLPLNDAVEEFRFRLMREALEDCRFNQKQAAKKLGLTYHQFRGYYRKYEDRFQQS